MYGYYQWLCMWEMCGTYIQLLSVNIVQLWGFFQRYFSCRRMQCRGWMQNMSIYMFFYCTLILNLYFFAPTVEDTSGLPLAPHITVISKHVAQQTA